MNNLDANKLYANKLDNVDEIDKILETQTLNTGSRRNSKSE